MELRQLIYLRTVAELEHVTRAAERLLVAQSAISRQVRLLEDELGAALFYREGKGIRLTAFGQRFLPHVERILREVEAAKEEAAYFHNPDAGTIRLGFPHSMGLHYVPTLVASFRKIAPAVRFDLVQARVNDLMQGIGAGDIEIAIVTPWEKVDDSPHLEGARLFEEAFRIVLPVDHPLAGRAELSLRDIAEEPFIVFKRGYTLRGIVWNACIEAGFTPKVAFEAEETDTVRAFVKAGLGVSLLPQTEQELMDGIKAVAIAGSPLQRSVGITWHKGAGLSGPAKRFADFAIQNGEG